MRIIFIRHADPDYENDSLTPKGRREAALLSERVSSWKGINEIYCSPLGRAKETASYSLKLLGRDAITYPWLREFTYKVDDPTTGRHGVPWDFMPEYWTQIEDMYGKNDWKSTEIYRSNPDLLPAYDEVCTGLDDILHTYGYARYHNYYQTEHKKTPDKQDATIVMFCHLGVICVMLSHLFGISPVVLFHSLYLAPTSVTVLAAEERIPGKAIFRAQMIGDTRHLYTGDEPVSASGYFTDAFQG
ncbi:MAG: histidine phosphatase family protein [Bacillus sp. (in: Bacteria)]|nr:histidine phosphatase family protein [Bacillus sp. (in: firmicutes)]MCM1427022.1 histidine phosphatase family protein [Eubacterium sp.]